MGLSNSTKIELTDKLEDYDLTNVSLPDTADYNKRPDYAVLLSDRKLQALDLKRYKYAYYPSLVGYGSLSANASRDEFNIFSSSEPWYPTAIVGLKLSVPIWDGLQKNSRVQQSKLGLAKVDNSLNQYRNSIQLEYTSAQSTFKTKLASLEVTKQNRLLAVEIARVSKVKYDNGLGSSLELTDAESSLKEADANYLNTLYDTIVAKIELDRVLGNTIY
jgi:outer membrane protein TolC